MARPPADAAPMSQDLTGQLLIAMPAMADPRFAHAVIYICAHADEGAMGLIVNKPAPHISFAELLEQLDIPGTPPEGPVRFGGPVEMTRGFVLHTGEYRNEEATLEVGGGLALSSSLEVLRDMAAGRGPEAANFALGYAGWGAGQLEAEFAENAWLLAPARPEILFGDHDERKWQEALDLIGVDPLLLSSEAGRA